MTRILRELPPRMSGHDRLEHLDELLEVTSRQLDVGGHALVLLGRVQRRSERTTVHPEHRLAEHLNQPAVGVPRETLITGRIDQAGHRMVVEADVQNGVHHPGHGELRPRAHADQQRVVRITQTPPDLILQGPQRHRHLHPQLIRAPTLLQVMPARLGGDGEPRRHRQPQTLISARFAPLPPNRSFWSLERAMN